jgi:hypothetical protein
MIIGQARCNTRESGAQKRRKLPPWQGKLSSFFRGPELEPRPAKLSFMVRFDSDHGAGRLYGATRSAQGSFHFLLVVFFLFLAAFFLAMVQSPPFCGFNVSRAKI